MADADASRQPVTVGRLQEIAFGWLGLTIDEFETITLHQFNCKLKGWQEVQDRQSRERWEQTRLIIQGIWQTVQWKGNKTPSVKDAFPMPWDEKPALPTAADEKNQLRSKWRMLQRFPNIKTFSNPRTMELLKENREWLENELGPITQF